MWKKLGYTFNHRNLHNISLGQGQEVVAEQALDLAAKEGMKSLFLEPLDSFPACCPKPSLHLKEHRGATQGGNSAVGLALLGIPNQGNAASSHHNPTKCPRACWAPPRGWSSMEPEEEQPEGLKQYWFGEDKELVLMEIHSWGYRDPTETIPAPCRAMPDAANIHLVAKWLSCLEKKLEQLSEGSHQDFRVFISAEPAPCPESHIIPQGILENSIKITSEAPTGMHANLHKALDNFSQPRLEVQNC
ncbi:hypothetical protein IHE44_0006716 [Lamprotornis superbus]|uniref:Dynein heavy chain region D6 P-loop domain-containing protein n=1 Tax=Lamprotornis superbus TaxID=245042 RepID=A0A835NI07_9PASS|nr:hypothetical protein IHE44_0006716 [Lamprotornis superbus]